MTCPLFKFWLKACSPLDLVFNKLTIRPVLLHPHCNVDDCVKLFSSVLLGWWFVQQIIPVSLWSCGRSCETCEWWQHIQVRTLSGISLTAMYLLVNCVNDCLLKHCLCTFIYRYQATRKRLDSRFVGNSFLLTRHSLPSPMHRQTQQP